MSYNEEKDSRGFGQEEWRRTGEGHNLFDLYVKCEMSFMCDVGSSFHLRLESGTR